jgi:uncharacterized protein YbjT (DUF2867 family)
VIVVTGATGYVGKLVAEELVSRGEQVRLLVRDAARAPALSGVEIAVGDYGDPRSLQRSLGAGDRVFMVSLHEGPERRVPLHRSFAEAAARAGVAQVVYLSFLNARADALFVHARSHGATEAILAELGVPFTAMRNGMYADDIPGWFDPDGVLREPGDDAEITFSYRPELAKAIAATLTGAGHEGRVYDVTSPPVTLAELAAIASEVSGRSYRYEPAGHEVWDERWRTMGRTGWQLDGGHSSYEALRAGELSVPSEDYRALTGEAPLSVAEIVSRLADELPLQGPRGG